MQGSFLAVGKIADQEKLEMARVTPGAVEHQCPLEERGPCPSHMGVCRNPASVRWDLPWAVPRRLGR